MPSIYTHSKIALDIKENLDSEIQCIINNNTNLYVMFSQSFDNLYYYNFLSFKKGKHIRKLGSYAHTHKVNKYFENILDYIKDNNLEENGEILCYLFGAINHYISDSHLHPYINYRTGRFSSKRKKETLKYVGKHTDTELKIDTYYYEKDTKNHFYKYKIYNDFPKITFSEELKSTLNYVFKKTFNMKNMGSIFNKSYNQSKNIYFILMYDPYGIKKMIYKVIDFLTPNKSKKISVFSLYKTPIEDDFFNKENKPWCNPIDNNIIYNESWFDRYNKTVKVAAELIKASHAYLNNKISKEKLLTMIGNNGYHTGEDLSDKRITQYYQY